MIKLTYFALIPGLSCEYHPVECFVYARHRHEPKGTKIRKSDKMPSINLNEGSDNSPAEAGSCPRSTGLRSLPNSLVVGWTVSGSRGSADRCFAERNAIKQLRYN